MFRRNTNVLLEIAETALLAALIFFGTRLLVQNFLVEGPSMSPNLADSEFLFVNKLSYLADDPQRGDVIVFRSPRSPDEDLVKRVIGLPNEVVEIRDGQVYVNDHLVDESSYFSGPIGRDTPAKRVPEGSYFVMGDNRLQSRDSRDIGPVPRASIVGQVWLVYWPPAEFGILPDTTPALAPLPQRADNLPPPA